MISNTDVYDAEKSWPNLCNVKLRKKKNQTY